jgi:hypothetical protein
MDKRLCLFICQNYEFSIFDKKVVLPKIYLKLNKLLNLIIK